MYGMLGDQNSKAGTMKCIYLMMHVLVPPARFRISFKKGKQACLLTIADGGSYVIGYDFCNNAQSAPQNRRLNHLS